MNSKRTQLADIETSGLGSGRNVIRETAMTIRTTSLIAATALVVLAQTAPAPEPVILGDEQLDDITAGLADPTTLADPTPSSAVPRSL